MEGGGPEGCLECVREIPREGGEVDADGGDDDGVDRPATDPLLSADLPTTISSTLTFDDDEGGGFALMEPVDDGMKDRRYIVILMIHVMLMLMLKEIVHV
jgi:hypothetical protein